MGILDFSICSSIMKISEVVNIGLVLAIGCLLIPNSEAITDNEKNTILTGIEAGKTFSGILEQKDFTKVLKGLTETIIPWVDAIGLFSDLLGFFLPEENEMLEEMKKGFEEVNKRLDAIKDEISEVKDAINWAVVKVKFVEIETNIRLLNEKLKEAHVAPNPEHGKSEYIRVYEDHYDEAGLKLFDAIVHNDQVFSENILRAGMEYTQYTRSMNQDYMRGLIALMLKSSEIEISYEGFKEHDRGMTTIWKLRLEECHDAMETADKVLEDAWSNLFVDEINQLAKDCEGWSHISFRDLTYNFLNTKYYWRYWFVLSYDTCRGWDKHTITRLGSVSHLMFEYYGRNFLVATSDSSRHFDEGLADSYIVDRYCPHSERDCKDYAAKRYGELAPFHGVARAIVSSRCGWAVSGVAIRSTWGKVLLYKNSWSAQFTVFYFG